MKFNLKPPCIILYRDNLGYEKGKMRYGRAKGFIIWIKKGEEDNKGLLAHELEHVRQFWVHGLLIHMILITWCRPYREWAEKKAYKIQEEVGHYGINK